MAKSYGIRANVINAGLGGYSTANLISHLALKVIHLKPKIVIFYVGFNDATNRLSYSGFKLDYSHAQKSWSLPDYPVWRHSRVLDLLADLLGSESPRDPHVHSVAWYPPSGDPQENYEHSGVEAFRMNLITLIGISRAHGAIPVLVTQATDFENHPLKSSNRVWKLAMQDNTDVISQIAKEYSVDLINVRTQMSNQPSYFADGLHMSKEGNRKRASIVAKYLIDNQLVSK